MYDPVSAALIGIAALGAGTQVVGAREAKKAAKKSEKEKKRQAELQARIETARTKRLKRIRQAQMLATTGAAGITGSIAEAPITAGETYEKAQIGLIGEQTALQKRQYGIERAATVAEANAAIAGAIGSFASTALSYAPTPTGTATEVFEPIGPEGPIR